MFGKIKYIFIVLLALGILGGNTYAQETNEPTAGQSPEGATETQVFKDTDLDGIPDDLEITKYKTDPTKWDTDGDGYFDGNEVVYKTDPLDPDDTPITTYQKKNIKLLTRTDPIAWYTSRISGILSFILFTIVVLMGLVQSSRSLVKIKIMGVQTAFEVHRLVSIIAFSLLFLHIGGLFFDDYFILKISEIIIPFRLERDFLSTMNVDFKLAVSIGIIGFYTSLLLIVTSLLRTKIVSMKNWRIIHYLSFFAYITFVLHGFLSGTDSDEIWMQAIYIVSLVLVIGFTLARVFRKKLFLKKPSNPVIAQKDTKEVDDKN